MSARTRSGLDALSRSKSSIHAETLDPNLVQLLRFYGNAKDVAGARNMHNRIIEAGHGKDRFVANLLMEMYGKCGSIEDASAVFNGIAYPNSFSWNIIVAAYARNGHLEEARKLFERMPQRNVVSWNGIITAYAQAGGLVEARDLFEKMPQRNMVSWNTMLVAYTEHGLLEEARSLFDNMPEKHIVACTAMSAAYAQRGNVEEARSIFDRMPQLDVICWNAMMAAYAKSGDLDEAKSMFDGMPEPDIIAWTMLLGVYAQRGHLLEARDTFKRMPEQNIITWNTMLVAYAHRGHVEQAKYIFDSMPQKDAVSWTGMIQGYVEGNLHASALELFHFMELEGVAADEICLIGVLTACNHLGLVEEGRVHFNSIISDRELKVMVYHYHCMIDLFGRAGKLNDAEELIENMPFLPDAVSWTILLASCKTHNDFKRGRRAAESASQLDPCRTSSYLLASNMCTDQQQPVVLN